ncbi:MAG: PHP domain-containing protein, partial [Ignavibacteria bacterium]|nr:PHP domain-containing protein [Ignavibacteria bacterium]
MSYDSRGSLWHRWDLHFHTPSSCDYDDKSQTNETIVQTLKDADVRVVAITDHHTMDVERISEIQKLGGDDLTVLPGIELRSELGDKPVHYICIFPEDSDLVELWKKLEVGLHLTKAELEEKGGDAKIYVPIRDCAELAKKLHGIITIHAGAKSNSIDDIENHQQFQQRIKYDVAKNYIDCFEIGQIKDIDRYLDIIFPITGLDKPLLVCSDNHNIKKYSVKAPLWIRADPTFNGLCMALHEPRNRVFIGETPEDLSRARNNPTKYMKDISFERLGSAPENQMWFSGKVLFNPGLVAIVGNKGSGKSALSDAIGLLCSSSNYYSFSFLSKKRFAHPKSNLATHFNATIQWLAGDPVTRNLAEEVLPGEVERANYLPQDHVENICNELAGLDEAGFEEELRSVIFSHVPEADRLDKTSLNDLLSYLTSEKQGRIDSLRKQLHEINRERATLEGKTDPVIKREIEEKIKRKQIELDAHNNLKPPEVKNPAAEENAKDSTDSKLHNDIKMNQDELKRIGEQIDNNVAEIRKLQKKLASTKRLIDRLNNIQKDCIDFEASLLQEASEIGIEVKEVFSYKIDEQPLKKIDNEITETLEKLKADLESIDPPGLQEKQKKLGKVIDELNSKLDEPNKLFQQFVKQLQEWNEKRNKIEGDESDP